MTQKKKTEKSKMLVALLLAIPCTYGFALFVPMSRSLFWIILYGLSADLLCRALAAEKKKDADTAAILLGFIFACFTAAGYELAHEGRLQFYPLIVIELLGLAVFLAAALKLLFSAVIDDRTAVSSETELCSENPGETFGSSLKRTLTISLLLFLCWLPYLVIFYPGTMSSDALGEIRQQLGLSPLTNHHPVIHQLFIRLCLILEGESVEKGTAIHSVLQMLSFSLAYGSCVTFIGNRTSSRIPAILTFCFFAFFPVHPLYAIMMEKGSALAPVTVALVLLLMKETEQKPGSRSSGFVFAAEIALSFLFCTLRNNALYAYVAGMLLIMAAAAVGGRKLTRYAALLAATLALVAVYRTVLFDGIGVERSQAGETLSVPLQQIARVAKENPEELSSQEFGILAELFEDPSELEKRYDPTCSDPVKDKAFFRSDVFSEAPSRYLKSYLTLGLRNMRTYLDAFLMLNYGYWYPDNREPSVSYSIYEPNDFGLTNNKRFESARVKLMEVLGEFQFRRPTAILFSIGFSFWLLLLSVFIFRLRGFGQCAAVLLIPAALWLTTLASPLYCSYRYLYPMVAVPSLIFSIFYKAGRKHEM